MVFYGFDDIPNIKFETNIGGEEGTDGARGTETGTIYFDIEKIKSAMTNKDTGGTSALIGLIAHESSHSEKYGETTGNLLIEEGFANSKEELARDKFKETDKTLSKSEIKEALAKIKEEVKDERAISDSLTVSSKDEPVENGNIVKKYFKTAEEAKEFYADKYLETKNPIYYGLGMLATLGDEDTWWKTGLVLGGGYLAGNYFYGAALAGSNGTNESQKFLGYSNQNQKLLTYDGINQTSKAILKDNFYEVNGFKYSKYYYEKLWSTGRGGSSLVAKEVLDNATKITPDKKADFFKYIYGNWEMVYNPKTKEIWHIQPIK